MSYRYCAFGLCIESDIPLDELREETDPERPADVEFRRTELGIPLEPFGTAANWMDFSGPDATVMAWHGVCAVRILTNGSVEVQTYPDVPDSYFGFPLLGPVMGWLLHRRGLFVLHASALDYKGRTIGFLGDKGAGKSTTAARMLAMGATLLTDDLLVIDTARTPPLIEPAFGQIKLMADSADQTSVKGATALPLVFENFPKRQFRTELTDGRPRPCDYLLVLERGGSEPALEWLDPATALHNLLRFSYAIRFPDAPADQWNRARHFNQCGAVLRAARVGKFQIPHNLEKLGETLGFLDDALMVRQT